MKKIALLFSLFVLALAFQAQAQQSGPVITFKENSKDFGDITQGQQVAHTFVLTNTGNQPLNISNLAATFGCTVPSWPKAPVSFSYTHIKLTKNKRVIAAVSRRLIT